jgi:hypothetical protein
MKDNNIDNHTTRSLRRRHSWPVSDHDNPPDHDDDAASGKSDESDNATNENSSHLDEREIELLRDLELEALRHPTSPFVLRQPPAKKSR